MKCPVCKTQLKREKYEDLIVQHCPGCQGYLLSKERLKVIQARPEEDMEHFRKEVEAASEVKDTLQRIRCPGCREMMEKRPRHLDEEKFFVDMCHRCNLIWLDAGELAKLKLKFELGERGIEQHRMIARRESMSPEEKKEYEERIDHLPEYKVFKRMFGERHPTEE